MGDTSWQFHNPTEIDFGPGALSRLDSHIAETRLCIVTTAGFRRRGVVAIVEQSFGDRIVAVIDDVKANPELDAIQAQADRVKDTRPDLIIALGGGSSIDSAKAIARLLGHGSRQDLRELLQQPSRVASASALPVVAIPTTAGTGAEVTPFGTVWDPETKLKYSVVGRDLFPRCAVLDPELTLGLPAEVTVSSGLDALSHALESTWNRNASPVSLGLAASSLKLCLPNLPVAAANSDDLQARAGMLQASTLAGLAISQSRTALAHAISYPLTLHFDLPHGLACSFTLPALLRFNAGSDDGRLIALAQMAGFESTNDFADALDSLFRELDVQTYLSRYVPGRADVTSLVKEMFTPGRADNNLRSATEDDVKKLVTDSLATLGI